MEDEREKIVPFRGRAGAGGEEGRKAPHLRSFADVAAASAATGIASGRRAGPAVAGERRVRERARANGYFVGERREEE